MRRFILSTLALAALASPATAQERICREPSRIGLEFVRSELGNRRNEKIDETLSFERRQAEVRRRLDFIDRVESESFRVFDRSFQEYCKIGDLLDIAPAFRPLVPTHCDFARPINQFGQNVICFAQVPPRE